MPPRGRKRPSDQSIASEMDGAPGMTMATTAGEKIATKMASAEESPRKRQRIGVRIAQKQALIDNLQLEVTERARKLRAQYNLQSQGLRTRIEIRVNRIPMALRTLRMGDLLQKYSTDQQKPAAPKQTTAAGRTLPPVPEKDFVSARSLVPKSRADLSPRATLAAASRPLKRPSDYFAGGDKENQASHLDNPKKRQRGGAAPTYGTQPAQVLSPASSNSRLNLRDRDRAAAAPPSPAKSHIARPLSPTKQATATSILSSMVEKARATRAGTARKPATPSTTGPTAGGGVPTATATRTRGNGGPAPASRSAAAAAARSARRISGISDSSDASTSTVVRKVGRPASKTAPTTARKATGTAAAPTTTKTVMSSIKKGVAGARAKKASAGTATAATTVSTTTRSGRVLRKRD